VLGTLALFRGDLARARKLTTQALVGLRAAHSQGELIALFNLGTIAMELGETDIALAFASECEARGRAWGQALASAVAYHLRGAVAALEGRTTEAESLLREALGLAQSLGLQHIRVVMLTELGHVLLDLGNVAEARHVFAQPLQITSAAGERTRIARALEAAARAAAVDRPNMAVRVAAAAAALRERLGVTPWPRDTRRLAAWLPAARTALGIGQYEAAWSRGKALTEAQAVETARALLAETAGPMTEDAGTSLTRRETQVAVLLAQGLSTAQIAEELVVAVATVRVHIEHIMAKLDLHSRTQVVLWVREHGPSAV
jgi:non-specific serine/threonine protein kinase